jgi:hypothetical protein
MSETADIRIELNDVTPTELAEAIGRQIASTTLWSRDGILETQVTTHEEVQYCFRNDPGTGRPRTALCLAGTPEVLTVAVVTPVDRGPDLDPETYDAIVREFYEEQLLPAVEGLDVEVTFVERE